jgi:hypothetical protein
MGEQAVALAKAVQVPERRHGGVRGRQGPELLLPGDEHPAAGGAPGHREHHRHRPGRADDPRGRRREAAFTQAQIPRRGWAIECRINAEDPFRNFLPSTGRLVRYQPPATRPWRPACQCPEGGGVRVDTGVYEGGEIPMFYDSMIAKLIVHGADRLDAIARCARRSTAS